MNQKAILITGAGKGLGLAVTNCFLANGWIVYGLVRTGEDALTLEKAGTVAIISDVTKDSVQDDIRKAVSHELSIIINNAGVVGCGNSLNNTEASDLIKLFDVHCLGALRICQSAISMLSKSGLILNISSRLGSITRTASGEFDDISCSYSYRVAKAAQNMLTQVISREYKDTGIRVCAVHPGILKTRTGPEDADNTPEEAAEKIYSLTKTAKTGKFYSLFEEESVW